MNLDDMDPQLFSFMTTLAQRPDMPKAHADAGEAEREAIVQRAVKLVNAATVMSNVDPADREIVTEMVAIYERGEVMH